MLIRVRAQSVQRCRATWSHADCHSQTAGPVLVCRPSRPVKTMWPSNRKFLSDVLPGSRCKQKRPPAPQFGNDNTMYRLSAANWLKVQERIEYKIISTTYKVLQSYSPHYLRDIITIQPPRSTRSSSLVTLLHPPAQSSLKITNRSFRYAAPHLWNKIPPSLRVPCQSATSECSSLLPGSDSAPKSVVGVSHRVFHSRLKTHLFSRSFLP